MGMAAPRAYHRAASPERERCDGTGRHLWMAGPHRPHLLTRWPSTGVEMRRSLWSSERPKEWKGTMSRDIDVDRRRFFRTAAMTIAAAHLSMLDSADAQSS